MVDMSLASGRLQQRVHIERRTTTQNATSGALETTWVRVKSDVPCAIESISTREFTQSRATQSELAVRIVMRRIPDFTYDADLRLVGADVAHAGKVYDPRGWLEDKISTQEYITAPCDQRDVVSES